MPFELYKPSHVRVSKGPRIGLSRRGYFSLNKVAYEMLGQPKRVLLFYDAEDGLVGLKPAEEGTPYSYKAVRQGTSQSYILAATSFLDHYGIPYGDRALHFTPRKEGDLLIFELA
jgi:hypothetical protein